jgi:hypothetical protein
MKVTLENVMFVIACLFMVYALYLAYVLFRMYMGFRRLDKERDVKKSKEKRVENVPSVTPSPTCEDVLKENCTEIKPEYGTGYEGCHVCAFNHQSAIRKAGCTTDKINNWCNKTFKSCDKYTCTNSNDIKLQGKTCDGNCTDKDCCADSNDPNKDKNLGSYCFTGDPETNEHLNDICLRYVPDGYCQNKKVTWDNCKDNQVGANRFCNSRKEAKADECKDAEQLYTYCFNEKATYDDCKDNTDTLINYCRVNEKATFKQCQVTPQALLDFCGNKNKKATFDECNTDDKKTKDAWCQQHKRDSNCKQN